MEKEVQFCYPDIVSTDTIEWIPDKMKLSHKKYYSDSGYFKDSFVEYNKEEVKDSYVTLMCPRCFALYRQKISYVIKTKLESDNCIEDPNI